MIGEMTSAEKARNRWKCYYENNKEKVLRARKAYTKKRRDDRKKIIQKNLNDDNIQHAIFTRGGSSEWKYDFQIHKELALNSGIKTQEEWHECVKLGFMPEGIYSDPSRVKDFNEK